MSCKRGQSSLLGLPSAADIMKRATCFMRGNAPCGVKGVMGYALSARGIFARAKMPNVSIAVYVSPGRCPGLWATFGLTARPNHLPGVCANWFVFNSVFLTLSLRFSAALGNMSKLYCTRLHENSAALGIARTSSALHSLARKFAAARHNPSKLGFCARLAQTLSFLIKPRGILSSKMTKPRGKTLVFLTKPRGMNDFVKPNEQSSSLLEYSAMARNRTFKKDTLYAFFYPEKPFSPSQSPLSN